MSRDGSVLLDIGDGEERLFRLALGELRSLQEATDASPYAVLERLMTRRPMVDEPREVIRWGLIGGGLPPGEASRLVKLWVDGRPHGEAIAPAIAVLSASLLGVADEAPGKSPEASGEPPPPPSA